MKHLLGEEALWRKLMQGPISEHLLVWECDLHAFGNLLEAILVLLNTTPDDMSHLVPFYGNSEIYGIFYGMKWHQWCPSHMFSNAQIIAHGCGL